MRFGRALITFVLIVLGMMAMAQNLRFQHITSTEGLGENAVTCLFEDRVGYLWIGTENGLFRYDGHHLRPWTASDGMVGSDVSALLEDADGGIWVATRKGGVTRISADRRTVNAHPLVREAGRFQVERPTCLFAWDEHTLMIGGEDIAITFLDTRSGYFTYWDGKGPIHPSHANAAPEENGPWCNFIARSGPDRLAIGLLHGFDQRIVDRRSGLTEDSLFAYSPGMQANTAFAQVDGHFVGAGWQPFLQVRAQDDPLSGTSVIALPDEVACMIPWADGQVVIGTRSSGLVIVRPSDGAMQHYRHHRFDRRSLIHDQVRCLLRDSHGRLWVGTRKGLCVNDPALSGITSIPLRPVDKGVDRDVIPTRIVFDHDGALLVLTNEGAIRFGADAREQESTFIHRGRAIQVNGLTRHAEGGLWSTEYGVFTQHRSSGTPRALDGDWTLNGVAFDIHGLFQVRDAYRDTLDGSSVLVLGVLGYGVAILNERDRTVRLWLSSDQERHGLASTMVRRLLRAPDGSFLVGTQDGVFRWDPRTQGFDARFERLATDGIGRDVVDLDLAADGTLWAAMRDGGVVAIGTKGTRAYAQVTADGGTALGLDIDTEGRVWCATSRGLFALDPKSGVARQVVLQGPFGEVYPGGPIAMRPDGRIAITAGQELFLIDIDPVLRGSTPPSPYLTHISVNDQVLSAERWTDAIGLASDERRLSISLSALRLTGHAPLRFGAMLQGVDEMMRPTDALGRYTWSSLPTGTFTLLARTIADDGTAGETVRLMTVHVAAPFWERWWFYTLAALFISVAFIAWSRYRIAQALKLQAVRNRIASDLHDEVGSSLSSITIGSQLASQLSSAENEQVKALLARIGDTSSNSLRSISDIVWAIDPKNDEGEALVKRMRRIAQELLERKGVEVTFTTHGVDDLKLPMELRKEVLLIFKEAVHNASKYAEAGRVEITLRSTKGRLTMSVRDDGRGFDTALHPDGNGLGNMRRRAETLGAGIKIESTLEKGTLIAVEVVLG